VGSIWFARTNSLLNAKQTVKRKVIIGGAPARLKSSEWFKFKKYSAQRLDQYDIPNRPNTAKHMQISMYVDADIFWVLSALYSDPTSILVVYKGLISNSAHFYLRSFRIRQIAKLFFLITWAADELQRSR
jgi:hypothetical protein